MFKRLNMLVLVLLIVSQTMIGPMSLAGVTTATGNDDSFEEHDTSSTREVVGNDNVMEEKENETTKEEEGIVEETESENDEEISNHSDKRKTGIEEETKEDNTSELQPQTASVQPFAEVEDEQKYVDEIILTDDEYVKSFSFKVKGNEFVEGETKVRNGDPFELKIDFHTISNDLNYGPGTTLKYELPDSFLNNFSNLKVPVTFGGVGTIKIDGGFVIITLNDGVMIGDTVSDITEGYFTIEGIFSEENDDWDKEIAMPKGEKFTVNFVPKSGSGVTIHKENGKPNKNGQKSDEIEWKVTVNTNLANSSTSPVFTDALSSNATGHKYDTTSVEVREIDVRPNGTETVGDIVQGISPQFNAENTEMTINLEAGKAYQITYKTIPENPGINEDVTYRNSANYDGTSDSGSTSVHFGKAIEKSVIQPGTDLVTKWTIKYNGNEQLIKSGTKMSDSWTTNLPQGSTQEGKQDLVGGANGVTINGLDPGDYEVTYDHDNQKFDIEFKKDFNHPIEINYSTKPVEGLKGSENFTVVNKAEHGQISASDTKTASYNQTALTLNKMNVGGLDYNTKTMKWRITANQAGYDLAAGTTFVDTFTNKNMVLDKNAEFKVTIGDELVTEGDQADYVLTDNGTDGFTVKLNAATNKQVIIEYTTSFDQIKNVDEDRSKNYHNRVVLTESGLPGNPQDTANINSNSQQKANGSKSGTYNYQTKEFTWTIIFNYNSNTLVDAVLKDVLPEEHEITEVTLEKGSINSGGTFVPDSDQSGVSQPDILGKHEFSHHLGEINQPYRLVYKTKMKDDVLPVDGENNYSVKNKAELLDGDTPNAKWDTTVTVNHSSKVLDQKNGRQVNGTETIAWNFLYNTAQSKLKNVKITDTFGLDNGIPNQLLDKSSLKVYKVTYTSNGTITKKGIELTEGTDYNVSFNSEDGATFVLEFEELDYGIYVEYESVFIGIKDSPISNELVVAYNDGEDREGSSDVPNLNFTYGAFASTSAGEFVIIKTDEATGEAMKDIEFTLKNRNGRALTSGKTDENGVLDFKMPFATGKYYLEEITPDGYEPLNNFEFNLKPDGGPYEGKQVVNVTNTKTADKDNMCPNFTITVKDVKENVVTNKSIKLVNEKTGQVYVEMTNGDGKVIKGREDLPAGNYKVYEVDGNDDIFINDIEVKYVGEDNAECNAEVRPEVTTVSGTKTWKDGGSENRPEVTINLFADGTKVDSVKINKDDALADDENKWTYSFENLRKLDNAGDKEIVYTIEEEEVTGYKSTVSGFDITNIRHSEDPIEVTVIKTWKDDENATEGRPDKILVNLLQNGTVIETKEITKADGWTYTFDNLTEFDDEGLAYEYTISEVDVPGYATSYDQENYEIINTRTGEKSIEITKAWKDTEETAKRPDEIEVELFRSIEGGNKEFVNTYTVKAEDDWKLTIDQLPTFDNNGKAYTYEIEEIAVDGYESTINGFNITNLRVGTTEVSGTKTWVDTEENAARPNEITIRLYANGDEVKDLQVTPDATTGDWTYSFKDLPRFDDEGREIGYMVTEDTVDGYTTYIDKDLNITNTRKTYAIGDYVWVDRNKDGIQNENEKPLEGVKVELFDKNGEKVAETTTDENGLYLFDELVSGDYQVKFTLTDEQAKKYKFTKQNAEDDTAIDSDADEEGWTKQISLNENNKQVTKDYDAQEVKATEGIDPTWDAGVIELVDIFGTKTWKKDDAESRPTSITINLLQNGKQIESTDVTAEDDWTYHFTRLDKYDDKGVKYEYRIEEVAVDGYKTSYQGHDITNTKLCEKFTVEIKDHEDKPVANEKFTFESEDGKIKVTVTTDKDGKKTFDREKLPEGKYTVTDQNGNKVGEIEVNYEVDCEDNTRTIILKKQEDPKTCEEIEITITEDGKPSKNKTYTLTSKDGKTIVTIKTDENGKVVIDRDELPNGKYTVTDKDGNVVGTVEIGEECSVNIVIDSGKSGTPTPSTKDDSSEKKVGEGGVLPTTATSIFNIGIIGVAILLLGVAMYFIRKRKEA